MNDSREVRIKSLILALHEELDGSQTLDADTITQARTVVDDINRLLEVQPADQRPNSIIDSAMELETRFAVDHPVAERLIQEIVEVLGKMGI